MTAPNMARAALSLAGEAMLVLPLWWPVDGACACGVPGCPSPGKHPLGDLVPHGHTEATTDADVIAEWWRRFPLANIGIRTGFESGRIVLDRDDRNGGVVGWDELERRHGTIPYSIRARTGGGFHVYLKHPGPGVYIASLKGVAPGVDLKADGGFVVAPPSLHHSGRRYEWLDEGESRLEDAPSWIAHDFARWGQRNDGTPVLEPFSLPDDAARKLIEQRILVEFDRRINRGDCRNAELVGFALQCRHNRVPRKIAAGYVDTLLEICRVSRRPRVVPRAEVDRALSWAYRQAPGTPFREVVPVLIDQITGRTFEGDDREIVLGFVADALIREGTGAPDVLATLERLSFSIFRPPLSRTDVDRIALEAARRHDARRAA